MSASSRPTRRPRSRKPSARLSAVVDLPTPPLPDATAMTAATPGISDCLDIGEAAAPCGGRCAETGCTPGECECECRCGAGADAGAGDGDPGLRSAVSAIIAAATPGIARTAASACARTSSHARASAASTLIEKNTLPSVTEIADSTLALVRATPRGDATFGEAIKNLLLRYTHYTSPEPLRFRLRTRLYFLVFDALSDRPKTPSPFGRDPFGIRKADPCRIAAQSDATHRA